jgi:hypothetical protein
MVYVLTNEEADELAHKLTVRLDEVSAERDALAARVKELESAISGRTFYCAGCAGRVKELEAEHKIMWRFALQVSEGLLMENAAEAHECKFDAEMYERALEVADTLYNSESADWYREEAENAGLKATLTDIKHCDVEIARLRKALEEIADECDTIDLLHVRFDNIRRKAKAALEGGEGCSS